eukprot:PhM_4_TR13012/c0_g1_i1/m.13807
MLCAACESSRCFSCSAASSCCVLSVNCDTVERSMSLWCVLWSSCSSRSAIFSSATRREPSTVRDRASSSVYSMPLSCSRWVRSSSAWRRSSMSRCSLDISASRLLTSVAHLISPWPCASKASSSSRSRRAALSRSAKSASVSCVTDIFDVSSWRRTVPASTSSTPMLFSASISMDFALWFSRRACSSCCWWRWAIVASASRPARASSNNTRSLLTSSALDRTSCFAFSSSSCARSSSTWCLCSSWAVRSDSMSRLCWRAVLFSVAAVRSACRRSMKLERFVASASSCSTHCVLSATCCSSPNTMSSWRCATASSRSSSADRFRTTTTSRRASSASHALASAVASAASALPRIALSSTSARSNALILRCRASTCCCRSPHVASKSFECSRSCCSVFSRLMFRFFASTAASSNVSIVAL